MRAQWQPGGACPDVGKSNLTAVVPGTSNVSDQSKTASVLRVRIRFAYSSNERTIWVSLSLPFVENC